MTRTSNARIAGFTFLAYIAATITSMIIFNRAVGGGESIAEKLVAMSNHTVSMRIVVFLTLVQAFAALVLAVTLYAVTRDENRDLALLAMACRLTEGVIGAFSASTTLALLWLATANGSGTVGASAANTLGGYLLRDDSAVSALFFAVGSTLFAYLLLRGRLIPAALAWLGVVASVLLVVGLPAQLASLIDPTVTSLMWLPMLAFEIALGFWLLVKGVGTSRPSNPSHCIIAGDV